MKEVRKLIASFMLNWLLKILPNGEFKKLYTQFIANNILKL